MTVPLIKVGIMEGEEIAFTLFGDYHLALTDENVTG